MPQSSAENPKKLPEENPKIHPLAQIPHQALPPSAVELGRIAGAWGVRGWLKIHSHSADADALLAAREWLVQMPKNAAKTQFHAHTQPLTIAQARWHGDAIVAQTPLIADRDAAQALHGARIFVLREHFPPLAAGEFYWVDLIGLRVQNGDGTLLGHVVQLLPTGPQTTLVVRRDEGKISAENHQKDNQKNKKPKNPPDILIPFVDAWIDTVDIAAGHIITGWKLED